MQKKTGLILSVLPGILFLGMGPCLASDQELTRAAVAEEIQRHFDDPKPPFAFVEEIEGDSDLTSAVNAFFKNNFLYIDWLSKESEDYREGLVESVCAFLEARGDKVSGRRPQPKKTVGLDKLKAVAVRNLFPFRVTPEGKIATLICAAAAGFADAPDRNYALEAFAFQAVFSDVKKQDGIMMRLVNEYGGLAGKLRLSTDPDVLVKRAQGVFWGLLYQNPDFEELLLADYEDRAAYLPFEISGK